MVVIDSDVLVLAFAYPNDDRQKVNQKFLEIVQTAQPATTIYNVMEVLGQLSFNLSAEHLADWENWFINAYDLNIIWDINSKEGIDPETWREIVYERPFQKMQTVPVLYPAYGDHAFSLLPAGADVHPAPSDSGK